MSPRYKEPFTLYPRRTLSGEIVWYYRTYDESGVRTAGRSTGETSKTQARNYCQKLIRDGKLIPAKEILFGAWADGFFLWDTCAWVRARLAESVEGHPAIQRVYVDDCRQRLTNYIIPFFRNARLTSITSAMIKKFRVWLKEVTTEKSSLAPKTINAVTGVLRVMLKWAIEEGRITRNPFEAIRALPVVDKQYDLITIEELRTLFAEDTIATVWDGKLPYYAANLTAAATGLRQGEIRAIRDEDFRGDHLIIRHSFGKYGLNETTKTKIVRQPVPIPEIVRKYLTQLAGRGFVFSFGDGRRPISGNRLTDALYGALCAIGIEKDERERRNITFHSWRHFFNTYCRGRNIPDSKIQAVTGHVTAKMTDHYTHYNPEQYREIAEAQSALLE